MKIRTRFLLPTLIGSIALVSTLLAYNLYQEMIEMSLRSADVKVELIEQRFHNSLFLILFTAGATLLIVIASVYVIANRISRSVQKLNNSALAIAAGQYGESIQVDGPKEISELANTLNTMSECLLENINRLQEKSLLREKMYGEYECAMLLQHLMLQKNIDNCRSDAIAAKAITFFSDSPRGLLLDFPKSERPDLVQIHLAEAQEEGFEAMYQLVAQYKFSKESQTHTSIQLDRANFALSSKGPSALFVWSLSEKRFMPIGEAAHKVESGDLFFLWNQALSRFYKGPEKIADLLAKVLKVFAQDGLETATCMLQKEIAFATKRKKLEEDIHLLCFQVLAI